MVFFQELDVGLRPVSCFFFEGFSTLDVRWVRGYTGFSSPQKYVPRPGSSAIGDGPISRPSPGTGPDPIFCCLGASAIFFSLTYFFYTPPSGDRHLFLGPVSRFRSPPKGCRFLTGRERDHCSSAAWVLGLFLCVCGELENVFTEATGRTFWTVFAAESGRLVLFVGFWFSLLLASLANCRPPVFSVQAPPPLFSAGLWPPSFILDVFLFQLQAGCGRPAGVRLASLETARPCFHRGRSGRSLVLWSLIQRCAVPFIRRHPHRNLSCPFFFFFPCLDGVFFFHRRPWLSEPTVFGTHRDEKGSVVFFPWNGFFLTGCVVGLLRASFFFDAGISSVTGDQRRRDWRNFANLFLNIFFFEPLEVARSLVRLCFNHNTELTIFFALFLPRAFFLDFPFCLRVGFYYLHPPLFREDPVT